MYSTVLYWYDIAISDKIGINTNLPIIGASLLLLFNLIFVIDLCIQCVHCTWLVILIEGFLNLENTNFHYYK